MSTRLSPRVVGATKQQASSKGSSNGTNNTFQRRRYWWAFSPFVLSLFLVSFQQLSSFARFNDKISLDVMVQQQSASSASPTSSTSNDKNHDRENNHIAKTIEMSTVASGTTVNKSSSASSRLGSFDSGSDLTEENGFKFYYPSRYNASDFDMSAFRDQMPPFIHIVETPLIQNQLNLTLLIETRLDLFEAFCLPTMRQQTSRDFIWMVRVDSRLSTERPQWLRRLIHLLQDDPRFYLVERDDNPPWRNGAAAEQLTRAKVYTGDQRVLEYYMAMYAEKHILETRIDGDDGLHYAYLQSIQDETMRVLSSSDDSSPPAFFYWCVQQELEWHPVIIEQRPGPFLNANSTPIEPLPHSPYTHGLWVPGPVYKDLCPTPGITRVYPRGTPFERVVRIGHHQLWRKFMNPTNTCARPEDDASSSPWKGLNCTQIVKLNAPFPALRSRTPTSASMVTVGGLNHGHLNTHYQQAHFYWNVTAHDFGLDAARMERMQTHVQKNLLAIAQEGLDGQCSYKHSCMENARKRLVELIEKANHTISRDTD